MTFIAKGISEKVYNWNVLRDKAEDRNFYKKDLTYYKDRYNSTESTKNLIMFVQN